MELHAEGVRRVGHQASLFFHEDIERRETLRQLRLTGSESLWALLARCRSEQPDVINVHTHSAPAWIWARRTNLIASRVVVMSYAADEPAVVLEKPRDVLRKLRVAVPARASFPLADGIWCVNQEDVEYYARTYHVARRRLGRFPHAVADSFYVSTPSLDRRPERLLFVGSFIFRKGVDVLARALERVVRERPSVEVVLAGTQSGADNVRERLTDEVRSRTVIYDTVNDAELRELYRTSSLLLVPSRREGLPISMLEGLACGCPVLAAANSGMLDTIVDGHNGWLETSFEPSRWAERILALLADPEALSMASHGAELTARAFRIEDVAREVLAWYARLP